MYPQSELTRLAAQKVVLQRDIALRRVQCVAAAARVAQPLAWLDRVLLFWRRLSPLAQIAAVPLGLLVKRAIFPRRKMLGSVLRWAPLVFGAMSGIRSAGKTNSENPVSANHRS